MTKGSVLILGARSDIGRSVAHAFAAAGYSIQLAARDAPSLEIDAADIRLRYNVPVSTHEFDALETRVHGDFIDALPKLPEVAVCAVGAMGEQKLSELDEQAAVRVMRSNYEGPVSILSTLANRFERRGHGTIVGISSVAGERGRATNYVYGSAKAGFTAFLSGLRNRLTKSGVHVVTVLPGFVATQMTEGMDLPMRLTAQPDELGREIFRAVEKGKNVLYVRHIWWLIMIVIRNIPEQLFKRLKI